MIPASQTRHQVLMYVNYADERLLKLMKALAESYQEGQTDTSQNPHQKAPNNKVDNRIDWEEVQAIW